MTDKEKQAIEELKSLKHIYSYIVMYEKEYLLQCVETVLNLVETQAKELEKKDKMIDLMAKAILNYDDQLIISKYKDIENVKEVFEEYYERLSEEDGNKNKRL